MGNRSSRATVSGRTSPESLRAKSEPPHILGRLGGTRKRKVSVPTLLLWHPDPLRGLTRGFGRRVFAGRIEKAPKIHEALSVEMEPYHAGATDRRQPHNLGEICAPGK